MTTTNGTTTSLVIDSPDVARFFGFCQLNKTLVVSTDLAVPCIRLIDRRFQNQTTYAGLCSKSGYGYEDGEDAMFNIAHSIILDEKDESRLLVTDISNHAIREVDIASGNVGTFYKAGRIFRPKDINQDSSSGDLFITTANSEIFILRYYSLTEQRISSKSFGYFDGPLLDARFQEPAESILINGGTALLVADEQNHRLRILNLITNTTSSICTGATGYNNGDLKNCSLYNPKSLLIIADTLYIGEAERIRKIEASKLTTTVGIDLNKQPEEIPKDSSDWKIVAIAVPLGIILAISSSAGFIYLRKKIHRASTSDNDLGINREAEEEDYDEVDESAMEPDDYYLASIDDVKSNDDESVTVGTIKPVPKHLPVINTTPCSSARELPFLPIPQRPSDWPYDYAETRLVTPQKLAPTMSVHHTESHDSLPDYIDLPNKQLGIETIPLAHADTEQLLNNTDDGKWPKTNIIDVTDPTYVADAMHVTDTGCHLVKNHYLNVPDRHNNVSSSSSISNDFNRKSMMHREPTPPGIEENREYAPNDGAQKRIANLDTDQSEDLKPEHNLEQHYVTILDSGDHNSDSSVTFIETS